MLLVETEYAVGINSKQRKCTKKTTGPNWHSGFKIAAIFHEQLLKTDDSI